MPGLVIGKVAIKVLPDTDGFREKVKRDLNGKEKPGQVEVKVIPKIDDAAFRNIQRKLKSLSDVDVNISPDLDDGALRRVELQLEGIEQTDAEIDPQLDWAMWTRAMKSLEKLSEPREVDVRAWLHPASIDKAAGRLAVLTRDRVVRIRTALDEPQVKKTAKVLGDAFSRISGLRFTLDQFAKFREEMLNLDRLLPKIGLMANGLGSLSAIALTAGGSLLSVSAGLIQMGAAGLALPGILGGIAVGLGVTAVALADFKKEVPQITSAWETLRSTISQNFWDVAGDGIRSLVDDLFPKLTRVAGRTATSLGGFFDNLAGSLQRRLVPAMSGMFDNLNKSIDIFSKRTDAVANIITVLGTLGAKYLPQLATAFGDMTQGFSDWLSEAEKAGKLTEWVDAGIKQIKNFGRVLGATTSIFWSLTQAAQAAGGQTLGGVADALERVAKAAASPGFQKGLTDTLRAAYEMMDQISSRVGPPLANLIESLSKTFQQMAPVMGDTVATAVTAIADALASPALQNGLQRLLSGFNRMVNELAPAMQPLAEKLGALGGVIGELAEAAGSILGEALIAVSPLFVSIAEAIQPVIDKLGELLSGALRDLAPVFSALATTIRDEVAPELPGLVAKMQELWDKISPALIPALQLLAEHMGPFMLAAINTFMGAINGALIIVDVVTAAINFCKSAVSAFSSAWTAAADWIGTAINAIKTFISNAWSAIANFTRSKWNAIRSSLSSIVSSIRSKVTSTIESLRSSVASKFEAAKSAATRAFQSLRSSVTSAINSARSAVSSAAESVRSAVSSRFNSARAAAVSAFNSMKSFVSSAVRALPGIVRGALGTVVSIFSGLPGRIKGALGNLGSLLYTAGTQVVSGLVKGITAKLGDALSTVRDMAGKIASAAKGALGIKSPSRVFMSIGDFTMQGLIKGIESQEYALMRTISSLSDSMIDTLGTDVAMTVSADAAATTADVARRITVASRTANDGTSAAPASSTTVENQYITLSLEDLKQLKDLDDFMDLIRVRTRMG